MAANTNHLLERISNSCFEITIHFRSCSDCYHYKDSGHSKFIFDLVIQIEIADACTFHQNTA